MTSYAVDALGPDALVRAGTFLKVAFRARGTWLLLPGLPDTQSWMMLDILRDVANSERSSSELASIINAEMGRRMRRSIRVSGDTLVLDPDNCVVAVKFGSMTTWQIYDNIPDEVHAWCRRILVPSNDAKSREELVEMINAKLGECSKSAWLRTFRDADTEVAADFLDASILLQRADEAGNKPKIEEAERLVLSLARKVLK